MVNIIDKYSSEKSSFSLLLIRTQSFLHLQTMVNLISQIQGDDKHSYHSFSVNQ